MPPSSWGISAPPWGDNGAEDGLGLGNIGPRQVASTVVAGMQQVTSSVRFLLIGCFQCSSSVRGNGCWPKRREETDRTWFDCDQLQGDHPFCYVNPVALDSPDTTSTTSSATPQHDGGSYDAIPPKAPTQKRRKFSPTNGQIPLHLPIVKRIQSKREEIKHYSRAPKMTLSPIMTKSPKLPRRNNTNRNFRQSPLHSYETPVRVERERKLETPVRVEREMKLETPVRVEREKKLEIPVRVERERKLEISERVEPERKLETPMREEPEWKDNKNVSKDHKLNSDKDSQVISFAAQLEQSLRKLEQEIQRADSEYIRSNPDSSVFDNIVESPIEECSTVFSEECSTVFRENGFTNSDPQILMVEDEMKEDIHQFQEDIWKPSELEDAFEGYNMAAFYSYGHYVAVDSTGQHRNQKEKYQEVFPPNIQSFSSSSNDSYTENYNNNNNNNDKSIINQNKSTESKYNYNKSEQDKVDLSKESETTCIDHKHKQLSKGELIHFINICVFENNFDDACEQCNKNELICDDYFLYNGRSFNKQLIYDLVKTTMSECNDLYKISIALSETYPIELVQKRVFAYLETKVDDTSLTPSGIQAFRNAIDPNRVIDEKSFKNAILAEKMIEDVLFEESKEDGRMWQDVKQEEKEIKEAITNDIFDDLISDSVSILTKIYDLKMLS